MESFERKVPYTRIVDQRIKQEREAASSSQEHTNDDLVTAAVNVPAPTLLSIADKGKGKKKGRQKNAALSKKELSRKYAENREEKRIREATEVLRGVDVEVGGNRPTRQIAEDAQTFVRQERERLQALQQELKYLKEKKPDVDTRAKNHPQNSSKKPPQTYEQMLQDFTERLKAVETKVSNISQTITSTVKRCDIIYTEVELLKQREIAVRSQVRTAAQRLFDDPESYARFHGGLSIIDGTKI